MPLDVQSCVGISLLFPWLCSGLLSVLTIVSQLLHGSMPSGYFTSAKHDEQLSCYAAMPFCCCRMPQDGVLQLSAGLLSGLSAWSVRAAASPGEQQLAAQLLADFGKHGPAPSLPGVQAGCAAADAGVEAPLRVVADRTLVSCRPHSSTWIPPPPTHTHTNTQAHC